MFDVDIDFADRDAALRGLHHIDAMLVNKNDQVSRHPSGVYFQNAPVNPVTGLCSLDYRQAKDHGYFSIDFLNQTVYQKITDEAHLDRLLNTEPPWELLDEPSLVEQLMHIRSHFEIVESIKPRSVEDLAIVLALIRPGKRFLVGKSRQYIEQEVWKQDSSDSYTFKKAHAISYAALIVVQMNLLMEELNSEIDNSDYGLINFE